MADDIHIRSTPAFRRHLEQLAESRGETISQTIKSSVMAAAVPEGGVPNEREVLELLGDAARAGSVSAMKELRNYHRERNPDETRPQLSGIDELAERRSATGA